MKKKDKKLTFITYMEQELTSFSACAAEAPIGSSNKPKEKKKILCSFD